MFSGRISGTVWNSKLARCRGGDHKVTFHLVLKPVVEHQPTQVHLTEHIDVEHVTVHFVGSLVKQCSLTSTCIVAHNVHLEIKRGVKYRCISKARTVGLTCCYLLKVSQDEIKLSLMCVYI